MEGEGKYHKSPKEKDRYTNKEQKVAKEMKRESKNSEVTGRGQCQRGRWRMRSAHG